MVVDSNIACTRVFIDCGKNSFNLGNVGKVQSLIDRGVPLNTTFSPDFSYPLHNAVGLSAIHSMF